MHEAILNFEDDFNLASIRSSTIIKVILKVDINMMKIE